MRGFAPEAIGLGAIFVVSLMQPWGEQTSNGVVWFCVALGILVATALMSGKHNGWDASLLSGLVVGFFAPAMFYLGWWLGHELGWFSGSWEEIGEEGLGAGEILFLTMVYSAVYGPPFAAIGAVFACLGHIFKGHRRQQAHQ
jgi:hypothetical protein